METTKSTSRASKESVILMASILATGPGHWVAWQRGI